MWNRKGKEALEKSSLKLLCDPDPGPFGGQRKEEDTGNQTLGSDPGPGQDRSLTRRKTGFIAGSSPTHHHLYLPLEFKGLPKSNPRRKSFHKFATKGLLDSLIEKARVIASL